eukprot:GHVN01038402.1.p1 GENE.GHVN01038402.1~~GHVN01038402.1.p1  ORF type:complete len:173 (+),score=22.35 GHVN01038402.1:507-1025(+)
MVNEAMRPTNQRSSLPSESSAPRTPKRRRSLPTPSVSSTVSGGIRVHQLAAAGGSPPSRSSEGRKKRRGEGLNWGGSQEEWAVGLVDAFSKSAGDLTKAESMIKKAFKGAVQRRAGNNRTEDKPLDSIVCDDSFNPGRATVGLGPRRHIQNDRRFCCVSEHAMLWCCSNYPP